ncbi:glycoside hydrolase family 2 protein [Lutibacter citreus]|uniref:glycoside hydrolase family 2 protein n=1 Tax=Lutibacter citreus TaxID=2138210 RepID=UPI000DBE8384|nr:glycoside hydrolase family 2 TIM barrel-domain containing protein [Lutibacter citreus]
MKYFKIYTLLLVIFIFSISEVVFAQNNTKIQYLSGIDKDNMVEWDFYCSDGMNSKRWTKIGVPSNWELQGFGHYNYGHDARSGKKINDEHGLYKHKFNVPKEWENKEVKIVFEGVMTDAEVKINGKLAGEIHQGAFYEFKYSISKLLKYGADNLLEVKVSKVSSNESINYAERRADFWIFGGIYHPVYLEVSPKENIERVAVDAKADGSINAAVFMSSKKATSLNLFLTDVNDHKIQDLPISTIHKENGKWSISAKASNVKTWNPESPNLYKLNFELLNKNKEVLHKSSQKIGFRTVEVRESDGIYVNGIAIKFKGVNRHSFYPSSGRTTSKALSIEHIKMMKDMNMNAVRMSHYPPDVHFLEACDSIGLFVIDEVCTWHNPYLDTEIGEKIVNEMVVRDVNHPSILLWANGNETGWNLELDDDFSKWDIQKREVIHPWNIFKKTNTMHYPDYHVFAYDSYSKDKIYFPTEFMHGLYDGGHGAGLDDYWTQMWNMPLSAGGFLWDFADEAVVRTDENGVLDTDGNHAADGIVGPYGEKEGSYFTIKEIWSPIYIPDRIIRDDFSGIFKVENRYHYTNLDVCKMIAKWVQFEGPEGNTSQVVLSQSEVKLPALAPEMKGSFNVELPTNWKSADALYLTATDQYGMEIFTWTYPVKTPKQINANKISYSGNGEIKSVINNSQIIVSTKNINFKFDEETGLLQEVIKEGRVIPLKDGPIIIGQKGKLESVKVVTSKEKIEVIALYEKKHKYHDWDNDEYNQDFIKWTVHQNGLLDLKVEMKGKRKVTECIGLSFSFPEEEVNGMKWLGDGPYRVWRNRMKGTKFQVWENDYNNTITGESGFVYPEFKGFFSSLNWVKVKGNNNNGFTVYCHSDHTFLRMLTPEQPLNAQKGATVKDFPVGDISFVKNIPAIGTKFQEPYKLGPQSNPEHLFGNDDEMIVIELTFDFK